MSDSDRLATLIATAYDTETFRPTLDDVRRRGRGRLRRRLPALLAALALLLVTGGALTAQIASDRAFTALCTSVWHKSHHGPLPPLLLSVDSEPGLRLYGTTGRVALGCMRDEHGRQWQSDTIGIQPYRMSVGGVVYHTDRPWSFVVGHTPPGTIRVDLRLDDASVRRAVLGHSWWAAMVPADRTDEIWISSVGRHRVIVGSATGLGAPTGPVGPVESDPYRWCEEGMSGLLRAPDVDPGQHVAPLITKFGPGGYTYTPASGETGPALLFVYGSPTALVPCGTQLSGFAVFGRDPANPLTAYVSDDYAPWTVVGQAPPDTVSLTILLSDGSSVATAVHDGIYAAWLYDQPDATMTTARTVVAVIAHTQSRTYRAVLDR